MTIDLKLISLKDGGRFAMSWIAGTNPNALRSNFQCDRIYSVDVTEVCEEIIKCIKMKQDKLSFRIFFRLCFGTIHIYAQQVQQVYNITLNFVCFNKFVLNQCSHKRLNSSMPDSPKNKKKRMQSIDDLDITNLLMESEILNDYTEDKFKFPNEESHSGRRKPNSSTCIQINQLTITHISWDNPMPDEEVAFGDESQDDTNFLLSGFGDSFLNSGSQKRKMSFSLPDCSPMKRPCIYYESIDDIRCESPIYSDTIYEAGGDIISQTEMRGDFLSKGEPLNHVQFDSCSIENINESTLPNKAESYISDSTSRTDLNNLDHSTNRIEFHPSVCSEEIPKNKILRERKCKLQQVIDTYTKIPKINLENVWEDCYNIKATNRRAVVGKPRTSIVLNRHVVDSRFQSIKLLNNFNQKVKARLKQNHDYNRQLIVEQILDQEYDENKSLFKIKVSYPQTKHQQKQNEIKENIGNISHSQVDENNNTTNIEIEELNNNNVQPSDHNHRLSQNKDLALKCSLDKIDSCAISFGFPTETGTQRSEWGKEGVMKKLINAWMSGGPIINMRNLIFGANRISAALAFHTLLDLAGQQYIDLGKNGTNCINKIKMGPETIQKINGKMCA